MSRPPKTEMIKEFIEEVKSYIPSLIGGLASLKDRPDESDVLEEIHRLVHTIKGASSMVGLTGLSHIAFQMEEYLEDTILGKQALSDASFHAMHQTVDRFREYCLKYPNGGVKSRSMFEETVAAFGMRPVFSSDSNWLADSIGVSETEREKLRKQKKPVQNDLGLVNLATGETSTWEGIESFAFSSDGAFLAMQRYSPPAAPPPSGQGGGIGSGSPAERVGTTLIVRSLASGADTTFGNVSRYV